MTKSRLDKAADRSEILEVSVRTLVYRDRGNWDELVDCFYPEAQITTSWFEGNTHDFIDRSSKMMGSHDPSDSQKHFAANHRISINEERAVCEYYLTLHQRRRINGYLFDFQTWSSTVDMFEERDTTWRILGRWNIYEKDRMDPHKRGEVPESFFQKMDLSPYPDALKYHCWRNAQGSSELPPKGLVIEGTDRANTVRKAAHFWLNGGSLPWTE